MADEVFALSPIAARPVMPGDADYDAIRDAFMETSRGRWFLAEYAKRNRNADTAMVLDAVARIEQNIAAQKQNTQALIESLAAIRAIVGEAKANVARAIAGLEDEAVFTAAIGGARNIREVATTLRECGADARICDLIDSQIAAIDAGHRVIAAIDIDDILGSFDLMLERIGDLAGLPLDHSDIKHPDKAARSEAASAAASAFAAPPAEPEPQPAPAAPEAAAPEAAPASAVEHPRETMTDRGLVIVDGLAPDELEFVEQATADANAAAIPPAPAAAAPTAPLEPEPELRTVTHEPQVAEVPVAEAERLLEEVVALDAEVAEDDAILDLIAREMAAPDLQDEFDAGAYEGNVPAEEPVSFEPAAEVVSAPVGYAEPAPMTAAIQAPQPVAQQQVAQLQMAAAQAPASLGAAVLANGIVASAPVINAALTPFRRMSQAEKIAFFS